MSPSLWSKKNTRELTGGQYQELSIASCRGEIPVIRGVLACGAHRATKEIHRFIEAKQCVQWLLRGVGSTQSNRRT